MNGLIKWDMARQAIAEAHSIDEVKLIRDKAEAYRYALRQAKEAPEVIRQAEEIKLRAERRAGQMLQLFHPCIQGLPAERIGGSRRNIESHFC